MEDAVDVGIGIAAGLQNAVELLEPGDRAQVVRRPLRAEPAVKVVADPDVVRVARVWQR